MNLIDQKKNKHQLNNYTKPANIVIKPSKIKYFFSPKEKPPISIVDKQLEEISPITV
jgi:hypothetical protein